MPGTLLYMCNGPTDAAAILVSILPVATSKERKEACLTDHMATLLFFDGRLVLGNYETRDGSAGAWFSVDDQIIVSLWFVPWT